MEVLFFGRKECLLTTQLIDYLKIFSSKLEIVLSTNSRNQKLPNNVFSWQGDLILCFRSLYILPKSLIENAKIAAINFHPGPPEYPGSGGINFALYENKKKFGVTAHLMNEKVDSGKILEVKTFPILEKDNVDSLLKKTHLKLFDITKKFIFCLHSEKSEFIADKLLKSQFIWSNKRRSIKEVDKLSVISCETSKEEINKRIRSFHTNKFPLSIIINDFKFVYQTWTQ